jgi:hypothetical protein
MKLTAILSTVLIVLSAREAEAKPLGNWAKAGLVLGAAGLVGGTAYVATKFKGFENNIAEQKKKQEEAAKSVDEMAAAMSKQAAEEKDMMLTHQKNVNQRLDNTENTVIQHNEYIRQDKQENAVANEMIPPQVVAKAQQMGVAPRDLYMFLLSQQQAMSGRVAKYTAPQQQEARVYYYQQQGKQQN